MSILKNTANKAFYRNLLRIVLPIAFQQFMLAAVNASDAVMLGFVNQDSLSASSLAGQITFIFNMFMAGLTVGTSILAAQYYGKGDNKSIEKIFAYVEKITFGISIVFFIASIAFPKSLMQMFTSEPQLISGGITYLRIIAASYLFTGISQIYLCIFKNTGLAIKSMIIGSSSVIVNIILNAMLIFGIWIFPEMGIAGAALSTTIAKFIEMIWAFAESLRKDRARLRIKYLIKSDKLLSHDYWKYTLPTLGNQLAWGLGFSMYSVIMGHLGSDAVAANSIANIVKNLIVCFCGGLANGGGIIIGNELGRKNTELAKKYGGILSKLAIIGGLLSGVVLLAITPLILKLTDLTPKSEGYLKWMLILCACYMVGKSYNATTIGGIFPAGGDSKFGLICDTVTMWVFAVPIGMLSAFIFKLPVVIVFLIINLDEIVKMPVVVRHYKKYGWLNNLTR